MTGARGGKSDGSKQQDNGPALFPRLHVAETKRTGPRGPPRNKMALYEQLTIPSHKFNPSPMALPHSGRIMKSPAMTTPLFLSIPQVPGVSHDSMYSYVPMSYMNPTMMPALTCIPSYSYSGLFNAEATSSMNTSGNKSTVIDGAVELPSVGGAVPKALSHLKYHGTTMKGRRDDDFAVPACSSATQSSGQTTRPSSPLHIQRAPRGQRALLRAKEPVNQKWSPVTKDKSMEVSSLEHGRWSNASGECVTVSVDLDSQETDHRELERVPSSDRYPATTPSTDSVRRADSLTAPSEQDMLSNVSSENQSGEGSERSQQRRGSSVETGSSMLEDAPAGSVKFQDVVNAFGQQEFWKTQMLMIRQQRIFSRQVFDLHRVIQVQQLLAKTLCTSTSIDEALEKENDKVHMAESPIAEVPEVPQVERPAAEVPEVPQVERPVAEVPEAPQVERPVAEVPEVPQAASPVAEVPQVSQAESSVAEVPEVPLIARAPQVPEIPEKRLETKASNENSRPSLDSHGRPVYPFPVPTQQVFNSEAPWQAPPYATNPWAVRMASPFMYLPYPGPYPAGYGSYPMMMPMYAQPGALQQQPVQFPTWQQPGMPHLLSAQDSSAMAAWYGQHIAPPVAPAASASIAPHACHFERLESSGSGQSTSHMTDTRPAGQDGERSDGVVNPNKGSSGETRREGRWVLGDRSSIHKKASDGAGPRGNEAECQNGDNTALEGSDPDHGQVQQTNNVVEPEANLEGPRLLKRMRTETGFEAGACRWFPILSPARRPIHNSGVIKVVPRALSATPELAANILMSIQTDRRR